jgi:putative membrane protein
MSPVMYAAAGVAGLLHVLFFLFESVFWTKPGVRKLFHTTEKQAATMRVLAFNQGFYNLFLAIGTFVGLALVAGGRPEGIVLTTFTCASMLGGAVVLAASFPGMWRGAVLQGLLPLVFIALVTALGIG